MLTLSDEAAGLIRTLTRDSEAAAGTGLRITLDGRYNSLSMALASEAGPHDAVVLNQDTQVFLSPEATQRLIGRTLTASGSPERSSFFVL